MSLLSIITPLNILEEKEKFFDSSVHNPIFRYLWEEQDISEYLKNHKSKRGLINAIIDQDSISITTEASRLFETVIDDGILKISDEIVQTAPKTIHDVDIETIVNEYEKALRELKLNYKVQVSNKPGFNFRPRHKKSKLIISKHGKLQYASLDSTVKHEITHIIRYKNWKHNDLKRPLNFLPTEEGLASFMGDFKSGDSGGSYFQHAAEYSATKVSLNGSFRDVFNYFKGVGYMDDSAWNKSVRHKLGLIDSSKPGDIMKSAMYFYNEQKIKELNQEEILRLFIGKISLEQLDMYEEYYGIVNKEDIVNFFELE